MEFTPGAGAQGGARGMSKTLSDYTKEDLAEMIRVEQEENARLKEALHSIHNYIANPEHHDMLRHILDIDKMVLSALYEEDEGECQTSYIFTGEH